MNGDYAASRLSREEYLVLDALACATAEGEAPLSQGALLEEYAILEDLGAAEQRDYLLLSALCSLQDKRYAACLPNGKWFATKLGREVMQFAETSRKE